MCFSEQKHTKEKETKKPPVSLSPNKALDRDKSKQAKHRNENAGCWFVL
jgi:hypothetical protein